MRLSAKEIEFLLSFIPKQSNMMDFMLSINTSTEIPPDVADELRDHCTNRLDTHGFDKDYKPTADGKMLELLIDKLFVD